MRHLKNKLCSSLPSKIEKDIFLNMNKTRPERIVKVLVSLPAPLHDKCVALVRRVGGLGGIKKFSHLVESALLEKTKGK